MPDRLILKNRVLFWSVAFLILLGGCFEFTNQYNYRTATIVLFSLNVFLILFTSVLMWIALWRMKKTIQSMPRLSKNLNVSRMVYHSLAYTLFSVTFVAFTIPHLSSERKTQNLLVFWFFLAFAALLTYFFFFLIIY